MDNIVDFPQDPEALDYPAVPDIPRDEVDIAPAVKNSISISIDLVLASCARCAIEHPHTPTLLRLLSTIPSSHRLPADCMLVLDDEGRKWVAYGQQRPDGWSVAPGDETGKRSICQDCTRDWSTAQIDFMHHGPRKEEPPPTDDVPAA